MKTSIKIAIALFAVILIASCSSGKKAYVRGDYYESVMKSVNRLQRNPGHKKSRETLADAYPRAVDYYENQARNKIASNDPGKWKAVVQTYNTLNYMYEAINKSPGALEVIPNPVNHYADLEDAKNNAAEESYNLGIVAMEGGTRDDAKQAYYHFVDANSFVAGYKDVETKLEESLWAATLKVLVEPIPVAARNLEISAEFFENKFTEYLIHQDDNAFIRFFTIEEAQSINLQPDQIIALQFDEFQVGQVYFKEKEVPMSKDSVLLASGNTTYTTGSNAGSNNAGSNNSGGNTSYSGRNSNNSNNSGSSASSGNTGSSGSSGSSGASTGSTTTGSAPVSSSGNSGSTATGTKSSGSSSSQSTSGTASTSSGQNTGVSGVKSTPKNSSSNKGSSGKPSSTASSGSSGSGSSASGAGNTGSASSGGGKSTSNTGTAGGSKPGNTSGTASGNSGSTTSSGQGNTGKGKVQICHTSASGKKQTIEVASAALKTHLDHGDIVGACVTTKKPKSSGSNNTSSGSSNSSADGGNPGVNPMNLKADNGNDVYGTVKATVFIYTKTITSNGVLDFKILDGASGSVITQEKMPGEYVWVTQWATFNGDERALTPEQLELSKLKEAPPPSNQDLFIEFTRPIYDQMIDKVRSYYRRY